MHNPFLAAAQDHLPWWNPEQLLGTASRGWYATKTFFEHTIGFSNDALHVLAGVCLQLLLVAVFRKSLRHPGPWAIVLFLEIANEWADLWIETWPDHAMQWGESAKDLLLTMALPTLLLVIARVAPQLLVRSENGGSASDPGKDEHA